MAKITTNLSTDNNFLADLQVNILIKYKSKKLFLYFKKCKKL